MLSLHLSFRVELDQGGTTWLTIKEIRNSVAARVRLIPIPNDGTQIETNISCKNQNYYFLFGRTKWGFCEIPSVHLSIFLFVCLSLCGGFLSKTARSNFSEFLLKVSMSFNLKMMKRDCKKKILFWGLGAKRVQNGFKMRFFKFYEKCTSVIVLIFYIKLQQHKILYLARVIILGKELVWGFLTKRGQNGPKKKCFKFYVKLNLRTLLIFSVKLQWHRGLKLS